MLDRDGDKTDEHTLLEPVRSEPARVRARRDGEAGGRAPDEPVRSPPSPGEQQLLLERPGRCCDCSQTLL